MATFDILFLGTCAADFSPKLEGECRDRFDLDARRASSVLLNGKYLIDCGPHALDAMRIAGVDPCEITDLFLTHLHSDHFNAENVQKLARVTKTPLTIHVSEDAVLPEITGVTVKKMQKLVPTEISDMRVTALYANHNQNTAPQHLLFERGERRFLYALDGAWFVNASYNYLKDAHLDLLVLDATSGEIPGEYRIAEHNTIPMIRLLLPSMRTVGITDEHTRIYLSHLAPSLHKPHKATEALVAPDGLYVAYDGLSLEL